LVTKTGFGGEGRREKEKLRREEERNRKGGDFMSAFIRIVSLKKKGKESPIS